MTLILLSLLLCVNGQRDEPAPIGKLWLVVQDAITLAIAEVSFAQDFINKIPQLESFRSVRDRDPPENDLLHCVGGLIDGLSDVLSKLRKLEKFRRPSLYSDTKSLEDTVDGVRSFNDLCRRALREVDRTFERMVHRKVQDIELLTNDVLFRVTKFELDYAKVAGGKP